MVSTRTKGGPIVMLDDHENPVEQQPTASPTKPGDKPTKKQSKDTIEISTNSKSKTQARKSVQEPLNENTENKTAVVKNTRSTRRNPNPNGSEIEVVSEPEQILQKRSPRKTQKNPQPPKTTASEKDVFDFPQDDGEIQAATRALKVVKYKGKNIVLKAPNARPASTVEIEIIEQNGMEANGEGGEQEATAEGDDGDDEREEEDLPDLDDTLGGGEVLVGAQTEDPEYVPEVEAEADAEEEEEEREEERERPKKLGRPPKGARRLELRAQKSKKQNGGKKLPKKKKRRHEIGENYGDYQDDSETDEERLREMSFGEYERKLIARMTSMEQELTITWSNIEYDRKSIDRRLKAAKHIMMDTVKDFNDIGIYNGIAIGRDDPNYRKTLPRILRGDPFPEDATNFDANHPAIRALFPDEQAAYETDIFNSQLEHVEGVLTAVDKLHKISEKIWLQSVKYSTILQKQKRFLETCRYHRKDFEKKYITERDEESELNREAAKVRARPREPGFALPERPYRSGEQARGYSANPTSPVASRKRGLDAPDTIVPKRQRSTLEQGQTSRQYQSSASESASVGGLSAPLPVERVVIDSFGDHTSNRTRRIHQGPKVTNDRASGRSSGIHDDNAPWTPEENNALDGALRQIREEEGRWRLIKERLGGPGTALAERSSREIREKAWEYKMRIENSGQELPDYWKNVENPSNYEGED
ncbi:hypothetical protein TWF506_001243 [Arthrobotrys conoides]|uniref:Myb-like domain-containing protein n=1 Tax=Arthrobotrys conoides TaxID=74498 RepID=A0AAN8NMF1_9PEZI